MPGLRITGSGREPVGEGCLAEVEPLPQPSAAASAAGFPGHRMIALAGQRRAFPGLLLCPLRLEDVLRQCSELLPCRAGRRLVISVRRLDPAGRPGRITGPGMRPGRRHRDLRPGDWRPYSGTASVRAADRGVVAPA